LDDPAYTSRCISVTRGMILSYRVVLRPEAVASVQAK
jgi:hypothetical protein